MSHRAAAALWTSTLLLTARSAGQLRAEDAGTPRPTILDESFRTEIAPRLDPVFDGPAALREALDAFVATERAMQATQDAFSSAVHETLSLLPTRRAGTHCTAEIAAAYHTAHDHGTRFLQLGLRMRDLHRRIARADALHELLALTPDYRWQARRAKESYAALVRSFREMRVAFHEHLATELRYAGCDLRTLLTAGRTADARTSSAGIHATSPEDPMAWLAAEVDPPPSPAATPGGTATAPRLGQSPRAASGTPESNAAKAIWITVDNTTCATPSRLTIDALPMGEIPPHRKVDVRTRAGQRSLCLLPSSDPRACGDRGTLRNTYLYDGLTLTVRCGS